MAADAVKNEKGEAICFTAGPRGALFALGVIHAYLAAGRPKPTVVAGVSAGALSAAAMQRCYRELGSARKEDRETARWKWYRRYLSFLVERPLDVIWNGVPDVSDLLAKRPPIRETAIPKDDPEGEWTEREQGARMEYYLLVKTIQFLWQINIRISEVARMAIHYVRWKELYPDRPLPRKAKRVSFVLLVGRGLIMAWRLCWTILWHPGIWWPWPYKEHIRLEYKKRNGPPSNVWQKFILFLMTVVPRPLFGREWIWLGVFLPVPLAVIAMLSIGWAGSVFSGMSLPRPWMLRSIGVICLLAVWAAWRRISQLTKSEGTLGLPGRLLERAELRNSLLTDFQLRLALHTLFRTESGEAGILAEPGDVDALLVASPLETLNKRDEKNPQLLTQLYTQPGKRQRVADALAACLAVPPLLRPQIIPRACRRNWLDPATRKNVTVPKDGFRLYDGALVCANPIPPLFDQLKRWNKGTNEEKAKTASLFAAEMNDFRVHLIHSTPLSREVPGKPADLAKSGDLQPLPNSVESAVNGLRLSARRDSQLEVWQTNYQSEIALAVEAISGTRAEHGKSRMLPILIDEIAPAEDSRIANPLKPAESELLRQAAAGCRATMAVFFRSEIGNRTVPCSKLLLASLKGERVWEAKDTSPGLTEICSHCTRKIRATERDVALGGGIPYTKLARERFLPPAFLAAPGRTMPPKIASPPPNGAAREPRIVFVASGGVFRGAFHIGMVGAMHAIGMKPDLIVGASVGTLMGAALGELFCTGNRQTLHKLVDTFVRVNETVALTRQFKSAMRDLSTRAQMVDLSPRDFRRKIMEGAGKDPTFATAGAPAELIDTISRLFLIPHRQTQDMAAHFVAEEVAQAVTEFVRMLRDHTVERLGIRDSVLGTSLLELALADILQSTAKRKSDPQPFLSHGIGFLATTVNLNTETTEILGAQVPMQNESYDFLQAALSSSAFPLAFPARRESQVYPKSGRRDVFYGDGGVFDNLPLMPATLALSAGQLHSLSASKVNWEALRKRMETPDLYVVGALDVDPDTELSSEHGRSIFTICKRAQSLSKNMKTRRYERFVRRLDRILNPVVKGTPDPDDSGQSVDNRMAGIVNGFVHAGVMVTTPTSENFLNGTFAFCESLQMDATKIRRSISDGCYRLLKQVSTMQSSTGVEPEVRALKAALKDRVLGVGGPGDGVCPFFKLEKSGKLECPFVKKDAPPDRQVWEECCKSHP